MVIFAKCILCHFITVFMQVCRLLESYIGREAVCRLIDREAGMELQYDAYPRSAAYILNLREKMTQMIRSLACGQ